MSQLNEFDSKKLLEQAGIDIPKGFFARYDNGNITDDIYAGIEFMGTNQYVIKVVSDDIPHKSDVGGVALNIPPNLVVIEIARMRDRIATKLPNAEIDGFYIQKMAEPGIECIIGIKEDAQFGKVLMFGLGGIYAEVFKDISMRVLPITEKDALEMISETKVYKILSGARGKHYDIKGIIDTIMRVAQLTDSKNIKELDINPLVVHEDGVVALDARIML